ncbi:BRF1-domain-containing protein [Cristinia sonorae]|uniref:B-related factor 1 n=1 Tax=Cristinia sonorae TaxID=1940300 RepID=A0A8K0UI77_9AGAR|nr:BRF1-domain-containing protein [Cristinia sonorae]
MTVCIDCGGTVIEYDAAAGNGFCVNCGTVVEENTIVNEIAFGETSTGAAMVQGSFVAQGATHARMSGPFGNRGSSESREKTIANASRKIQQVATVLRLSEVVQLAATRLYTLAVEHKFTKGRKSMNVVAVCLYVACRQKETRNYMLIDFSDLLQVNVFELGHTYLQLVQTLNLRLPLVDPSHYISRFAALLEFGDETPQVALDATRLVQRFDRDWMTRGRRPSGICGAALLLAARMNNFRRSVEEIVQVVKIADSTLRKRVEEFRKTGSAELSVADFRSVWLEEEMDPPAYIKGKQKEAAEAEAAAAGENGEVVSKGKGKGKAKAKGKGKKRKRKRGEDTEDEDAIADEPEDVEHPPAPAPLDPALFNEGILAGALGPNHTEPPTDGDPTKQPPLFFPDLDDLQPANVFDPNLDPALFVPSLSSQPSQSTDGGQRTMSDILAIQPIPSSASPPRIPSPSLPPASPTQVNPSDSPAEGEPSQLDTTLDKLLASEVSTFLTTPQGISLSSALDHAETVRQSQFVGLEDDELQGLDEEELDAFILTEEEVKIKERVWVELNKDYLEALAVKQEAEAAGETGEKKSRKRRKTTKTRDGTTTSGATAAESVRNLIKKNPKYSKRINYDALKDLFTDVDPNAPLIKMSHTPTPAREFEDGDDGGETDHGSVYPMSDVEGVNVVVEEGGGGVGEKAKEDETGVVDDDDDLYADPGEGSYVEWDGYEQEV